MLYNITQSPCINFITLSPENPTHSNNLMIIGGRSDNTLIKKIKGNQDFSCLSETFLTQLHSLWPIQMNDPHCLQGERFTLAGGLPLHSHISSSYLRNVYKAARVTQIGGLPYLNARVTLAGGLTFTFVNTPGRVNPVTPVNFLIVSRPFECNRALHCVIRL